MARRLGALPVSPDVRQNRLAATPLSLLAWPRLKAPLPQSPQSPKIKPHWAEALEKELQEAAEAAQGTTLEECPQQKPPDKTLSEFEEILASGHPRKGEPNTPAVLTKQRQRLHIPVQSTKPLG